MARTRRDTRLVPLLLGVLAAMIGLALGAAPLECAVVAVVLAMMVSVLVDSDEPVPAESADDY